jgi:hypothetical protein
MSESEQMGEGRRTPSRQNSDPTPRSPQISSDSGFNMKSMVTNMESRYNGVAIAVSNQNIERTSEPRNESSSSQLSGLKKWTVSVSITSLGSKNTIYAPSIRTFHPNPPRPKPKNTHRQYNHKPASSQSQIRVHVNVNSSSALGHATSTFGIQV